MSDRKDELLKDEEFINRVLSAASEEEVISIFKEKGIEITAEQIHATLESRKNQQSKGELNLEQLEAVAGGFWGDFWSGFKYGFTQPAQAIGLLIDNAKR